MPEASGKLMYEMAAGYAPSHTSLFNSLVQFATLKDFFPGSDSWNRPEDNNLSQYTVNVTTPSARPTTCRV